MKKNLFYTVIALVLLASCQSLKVPEENSTMLVVKVITEKVDNFEYFASYKIKLDSGDEFMLRPAEGFQIFEELMPGTYKITGVQSYYQKTGKLSNLKKMNIPFTLEPGKITILDKYVSIYVDEHPDKEGWFVQGYKFKDINTADRNKAEIYLSGLKNFEYWKIREKD